MSIQAGPAFPWALFWFSARRIWPLWSFVALVIFLMQLAVSAIVHDNDNVRTFLRFIEILPAVVKTALGGEALQTGNLAGLMAIGYQHPLVLFLFLFFGVSVPTLLLTRETQTGSMELLLSRCVTKGQIYTNAAVLTLGGMGALAMIMFLGTVTATALFEFNQPIPLQFFFRLAVSGALVAMASGGVSLFMAGVFAGRNTAVGGTVAFLVLDYFAWVVGQWWPRTAFLKPVTFFYYVNGGKLARGWPWDDILVLASIALVAALVGSVFWRRRDLPL